MNNPFLLIPIVLLTVALNTAGQSLLKLGAVQNPLNIYLFSGLLAYACSTVFYVAVLSKVNVSVLYPVVFGLTIIAVTLSGAIFLKEQVSYIHWVGIGLMLSGLVAIAFGKIS
ncbi:MAG TPA: small multidrug resistance protein [Cyanobacteria bacterium UBA8803]|nr:small multidrug resistance protein [Cyanobacteria bacterium UBA9273]HBL58554.1 small multidrug resistance protein [Cyanobacteria bacterium UBA8803]